MQIGLWKAENHWDEMGSKAYLEAAAKKVDAKASGSLAPEELDAIDFGDNVIIPDDKKKDAFPIPWGFLVSFQEKFKVMKRDREMFFSKAVTKSEGPKNVLVAPKMMSFSQLPAVKKRRQSAAF